MVCQKSYTTGINKTDAVSMHKKLVVETNNQSGKDYIKNYKVQSVMK